MDKRTVHKLQGALCNHLMLYFQKYGYQLDDKEWVIYGDFIRLPFFAMSTKGPYMTLSPSIVYYNVSLNERINAILTNRLHGNGTFVFSTKLDRFFGIPFAYKRPQIVIDKMGGYSPRLHSEEDVLEVKTWFVVYMEEIGWKLISEFRSEETTYDFYNKVFREWVKLQLPGTISIIQGLDVNAHITMLYLGLRDKREDVQELLQLTKTYKKGKLYMEPIAELQAHFA